MGAELAGMEENGLGAAIEERAGSNRGGRKRPERGCAGGSMARSGTREKRCDRIDAGNGDWRWDFERRELVRGAHELSGCAGWMVVTDEPVPKGQRLGQLESLAAGPAIARAAKRELARGKGGLLKEIPADRIDAYKVAEAARLGDTVGIEVYLEAGRLLGYGVANLVSLFDPEIVVIGGGLVGASDLFLDALRRGMKERAQPIAVKKVKVAVSRLGGDANLLGAVWAAMGRGYQQSGNGEQ